MNPHPLANIFKRSNYDEPIASEFCALDYLYEVLLEIRESENCDKVLYGVIHDGSLNRKHDCNDDSINSINVNVLIICKTLSLGMLVLLCLLLVAMIMIGGDSLYDLENLFKIHDEYEIDNIVCNIIESGFGRVSTLDPTYLENVQSCESFDKSGFGEVMTLVNVNPTI